MRDVRRSRRPRTVVLVLPPVHRDLRDAERPVDQSVGHHLALRARIALRTGNLGVAGECGKGSHARGDRQQGAQPDHRVGSGPDGDPTLGLGLASTSDDGLRVQTGGLGLRTTDRPAARSSPRTRRGRRPAARRRPAGPRGTGRRSRGPHGRPPLGDTTGPPGRPRVRELLPHDSASPRWRCPRCGDSRRARATIDATPWPRLAAGMPRPSWSASTDSASSAACAACAAVAVQTSSSSARIRSMRSASSSPLGPSSATVHLAPHRRDVRLRSRGPVVVIGSTREQERGPTVGFVPVARSDWAVVVGGLIAVREKAERPRRGCVLLGYLTVGDHFVTAVARVGSSRFCWP